jgi:hypothetical protein
MLSCKDVTALVSAREDRALRLREKVAMQWHLAICVGCRRYAKQIAFISQACRTHSTALGIKNPPTKNNSSDV